MLTLVGTGEKRGLEDLALQELGADVEGGQGVVAVERIAGVAAAVEYEVVGVHADVGGDQDGVAREVDEGDQTGGRFGRGTGGGDRHGELLRLGCWSDGVDGADDGAVGVAAAGDRDESGGCQSEFEWGPEGLRQRPNGAPMWPRLGVCFCFNSC